jgi:hypothetical protein
VGKVLSSDEARDQGEADDRSEKVFCHGMIGNPNRRKPLVVVQFGVRVGPVKLEILRYAAVI